MIPQPSFHPNLIPVIFNVPEDLANLVKEMRLAATATPDVDIKYAPSGNVEEAEKKAPSVAEALLSRGILRFASYKGRMPVNICFTLRKEEDFSEWNLSISHATLEGPVRVNDELAIIIVNEFLGEGYQEVPPKAVWDTVRHFIKRKD